MRELEFLLDEKKRIEAETECSRKRLEVNEQKLECIEEIIEIVVGLLYSNKNNSEIKDMYKKTEEELRREEELQRFFTPKK